MTSESTRKVIDQMNAANEVAKAELMILDSEKEKAERGIKKLYGEIDRLVEKIQDLKEEKAMREKAYEFTMILMILSLVFGFAAIGYAVWV